MGWNNPPVPWREFERRLSWRQESEGVQGEAGTEAEATAGAGYEGEAGEVRNGKEAGAGGAETGKEGEAGAPVAVLASRARRIVPWAELHCHSSYSFLDGASDPEKLITAATELGLSAIAITDHDGMYGVPQFAQAAARIRAPPRRG